MRGEGIRPDVVTYTTLIQACASAGQPLEALKIFEEAQQKVNVNIVIFNAILDAVSKSHPAKSRELYCSARSLYGQVEGIENGNPELNVRCHSEGAGEVAVRWWLEERVPEMTTQPERLIIFTGWGKFRSAIQNSDLHGRIKRLLAELRVPTLPVDNRGCFVVDAQAWRRQQSQHNDLVLRSPQSPSPN